MTETKYIVGREVRLVVAAKELQPKTPAFRGGPHAIPAGGDDRQQATALCGKQVRQDGNEPFQPDVRANPATCPICATQARG